MTGAFICTLSEEDWKKTRELGVYGNRYYKEGTSQPLSDVQQLSIVRDLISMKEGDIVFFHIRGKKTIHGIYKVRSTPYFDNEFDIWNNPLEPFPYRFLFEPHPGYKHLADYDANIEVLSLYEFIDRGEIRSLVTLENEVNIEARGVRKILVSDAQILLRLLHRDFKYRKLERKLSFTCYFPSRDIIPIKDCVFKVGRIENSIKAVLMYELAHNGPLINKLFSGMDVEHDNIDFCNEFFIAQTARKSIDIFITCGFLNILVEVKADRIDEDALTQSLYYRDLLAQRKWIDAKESINKVVLVGKRFTNYIIDSIDTLVKIKNGIQLIQYRPINNGKWAEFEDVS